MFLSIYSVLQGIIHVFLLTDTMRGIWGYGVFYNTLTGRREVVPQHIQELHNFNNIQVVVSCCYDIVTSRPTPEYV